MRILLLTQWFDPEPVEPSADMAVGLRDLGHEVTVLTGFPHWPYGKIYPGYRIRPLQRDSVKGIQVLRVAEYPYHGRSGIKRICSLGSFAGSVGALAPWVCPKPDLIHAMHPATVWFPALMLSRLWRVPLTLEIQDLWPDTLSATGLLTGTRWINGIRRYCLWHYSRCKKIRVITSGFKSRLVESGVPSEKVSVISNYVNTDLERPVPKNHPLARELGLEGGFNIIYAGTVGLAQGLDVVVEAARLLQSNSLARFVIVGDGIELPRLKEMASGLRNMVFLGRFPADRMGEIYSLADALLVHLNPKPLFSITIPHKIFSYLCAAKPIFGGVEGDAANLITSAGAGIIFPPGNSHALASAVETFQHIPPEWLRRMGEAGRSYAIENYGRTQIVEQLNQFFRGSFQIA